MNELNTPMLEAALSYARRGYLVFPCKPRSKEPIGEKVVVDGVERGGFYLATADKEKIGEWWRKNPEYNIAIRAGKEAGLIVVDDDDGGEVFGLGVPETLTAKTSDGYHLYYRYPTDHIVKSTALGSKLDIKSDGGYVLAPGSVHPDGTKYTWLDDVVEMAAFPLWLIGAESDDEGSSSRLSRTLLGDALRDGVPEPEEFEPDVLLKGKAHQVFSGPGSGKSWVALWLAARAIERGQTVLYLDMENGYRIISGRLQDLDVGDDVDQYLNYYDFPALDMSRDTLSEYASLLDELQPDLIVFDSWVNFLAASGMDENSNTDVERWSNAYVHPARTRDCTVVLLDHIPHEGNHSRGATRKKDMVDVQWRLKKTLDFDRTRVGYIQLTREKDREGWLPERVGFSLGGTEEGFQFKRSEGTIAHPDDRLPESASKALETLDSFAESGTTYTKWRKATEWKNGEPMPDSTFRTAIAKLKNKGRIRQDGDRYYSNNRNQTAIAVGAGGQELQHSTAAAHRAAVPAVDDGSKDELLKREALGEMDEEYPF